MRSSRNCLFGRASVLASRAIWRCLGSRGRSPSLFWHALLTWLLRRTSPCDKRPLINTSLQRSVCVPTGESNRFSGFRHRVETAEAVHTSSTRRSTPLKRGVNERGYDRRGGICAILGLMALLLSGTVATAREGANGGPPPVAPALESEPVKVAKMLATADT